MSRATFEEMEAAVADLLPGYYLLLREVVGGEPGRYFVNVTSPDFHQDRVVDGRRVTTGRSGESFKAYGATPEEALNAALTTAAEAGHRPIDATTPDPPGFVYQDWECRGYCPGGTYSSCDGVGQRVPGGVRCASCGARFASRERQIRDFLFQSRRAAAAQRS